MQSILNEPKLYDGLLQLPETMNFIGFVIGLVTNPSFSYIEGKSHKLKFANNFCSYFTIINFLENANKLAGRLSEYGEMIGMDFDITKVWADDQTFSKFGNILCGKPFPHSTDLRIAERTYYMKDYKGPDVDELIVMPSNYKFMVQFCIHLY